MGGCAAPTKLNEEDERVVYPMYTTSESDEVQRWSPQADALFEFRDRA